MSRFDYIELFAGIGGFRSALDELGGRCVFASEIDRFAQQSYKALYSGADELRGDITKIDARTIPDHDLLVAGFPCQSFSVAGQRKGFDDTRGTLFFEIARIAKEKRPRVMLLENVKGLLSHDEGRTIEIMAQTLDEIGYTIDFAVLNSKYFGVPQNRERIFIVCARDMPHKEWNIEGKDVVSRAKKRIQSLGVRTFNFDWPDNSTVTKRLRDVLESEVDEKYYLSEEKTAQLITQLIERDQVKGQLPLPLNLVSRGAESRSDDVAYCLKSAEGGSTKQHLLEISVNRIGNVHPSGRGMNGAVYADSGLSPTLTTNKGEGTKVLTEYTVLQKIYSNRTSVKHDETGTLQAARLDKVPQVVVKDPKCIQLNQRREIRIKNEVGTLHTSMTNNQAPKVLETEVRPVISPEVINKTQNGQRFKANGAEMFTITTWDRHGVAIGRYPRYRIRRLTPRECWRLQGFSDEQFDKARAAGVSDSQLYKQAGNAVTVNVISATSRRLIRRLLTESVGGNRQASENQRMEAVV